MVQQPPAARRTRPRPARRTRGTTRDDPAGHRNPRNQLTNSPPNPGLDKTIASRTAGNGNLNWLFNDHQGTQQVSVNASTQQVSTRRQTPYGVPRGDVPVWPTNKGFVGGDNDPTGMIHLGARDYDPKLGRFISVDPIQDLTDPQQWNGYAYANNNPVTLSDPSGLWAKDPDIDDQYGRPQENTGDYGDRTPGSSSDKGTNKGSDEDSTSGGDSGPQEFLKKSVHLDKPAYKVMKARGYSGQQDAALKDLLAFASVSPENWIYICTIVGGSSSEDCADANPVGPYLSGKDQAIMGGAIVAGYAAPAFCLAFLAVCANFIKSSIDDEAEFAATGNLIGSWTGTLTVGGGVVAKIIGKACSFSPETPVLMADGSTKKIGELADGDLVLSADPDVKGNLVGQVEKVHRKYDFDLVDLRIEAGRVSAVLHTTSLHPFWSENRNAWVEVKNLLPGDTLRTPDGGSATVLTKSERPDPAWMYNLTVADIHTYYVLAGNTPVLVHNDGGVPPFVDGQDFEWNIKTPKGNVGMLAETSVSGGRVTLSNVVVYGDNPELTRGSLGTSTMLKALRGQIAPAAAAQGFNELTISGIRLTGPVGHRPDFTLDLKKYAAGGEC
ncbi:RHS repeat-associated core domain-containing protein [Actinoplanes sp. CA-131856]